jgi:arsenate reductase
MVKRVLVICTGNSCRSQMAEGFLRDLTGGSVEVYSAGTHPSFVHPLAIEVMREIGIDISGHTSKSVREFVDRRFDFVITVCDDAKASCPVFPGSRKTVHMPFEDPVMFEGSAQDGIAKFREVRDKIKAAMGKFVDGELPGDTSMSNP